MSVRLDSWPGRLRWKHSAGGGTRYGSTFSGVVRRLPGYRRRRSVTPGYSRYRRAETWKSLRSMCAGGLVSGSVSCFVPNFALFPPAGHLIALQSRPQLTCSVSFSHCHLLRSYSGVSAFLRCWLRHIRPTANGGGKKTPVHYKCNASWSEQMTDLQSQAVLKVS